MPTFALSFREGHGKIDILKQYTEGAKVVR